MSKEEYNNLSSDSQVWFIENGGTISPSTKEEVCCDSTSSALVEVVEKQVESSFAQPATLLGAPSDGENLAINSLPTNGEGSQFNQPLAVESEALGEQVPDSVCLLPELISECGSIPTSQLPPNSTEPERPASTSQWAEGFDIKDPVELLFLLDDDIKNNLVQLHSWQVEFMMDFALDCHTKNDPFKAVVRACNGSGKDKYVVAASVVWLCMRYSMARGVVTNGSGVQLDNQTEKYIRYLCERVNHIFTPRKKDGVWKCTYRYYECLPTQSPIVLFATDEPNKAEGYHPLKAGGKMAIFASEAKAIPDAIFTALTRCTGFTHRVDVSTPGPPIGYFYDQCSTAISRKGLESVLGHSSTIEYHITAFDCPHITANEIQQIEDALPGGKSNPVYKSAVLAEFSTTDEMVVIPYTYIWRAVKHLPKSGWLQEPFNKAGLDLSDGGAETVLLVRNGNKHLKTIPFRFDNTEDTLDFLEEQFKENELTSANAYIYADSCGIGKPMLNALRRRGWSNIKYVDSRNKAVEPRVYFNRGTELFFNVRKLLERHELIIQEDKVLLKQLSTRYYKISAKNVHQLLTKLEQRSRGYPSPDRADAFNLAFWDYKSTVNRTDFSDAAPSEPFNPNKEEEKQPEPFSLKQWAGNNTTNLETFRRNVSKRQPMKYLQHELDRYIEQRKK